MTNQEKNQANNQHQIARMQEKNQDQIARMQELIEILNKLNYDYYTAANSDVADERWDELYQELVELEEQTKQVFENSPTQKVGGELISEFSSQPHKAKMLSLDKTKTADGLRSWEEKIKKIIEAYVGTKKLPPLEFSLEWKFDGLTVSLLYQNKKLVRALTRGNGSFGEMILPQIETIKSVPKTIDYSGEIEVQGECLMRLSVLEQLNKTLCEPLKNARNAAAGALRNLDPAVTAKRKLDAYFYNIGYNQDLEIKNQGDVVAFLERNKFEKQPLLLEKTDLETIIKSLGSIEEKRKQLDFLIDGLVIKVWDISTRDVLGSTAKFPRWAIAYKFESEIVCAKLLKINWEVGRTGKLTPLATLEPIDIGGVCVSKATLNNYEDALRKGVFEGANVLLRRSNDVIPEIMGLDESEQEKKQLVKPTHCPHCNAQLRQIGANLFCENSFLCKPQLVAKLVHFASRNAMDIEFFAGKTAQQLFETLKISSISQLYKIQKGDLKELPRFGEKKEKNILDMIEKSKTRPLENFIYALGIPNVGAKNAQELAKNFDTIQHLANATTQQLVKIQDIGEIVAQSIVEFFINNNDVVEELLELGVAPTKTQNVANQEGFFAGKTVVLTGTLEKYNREQASKMIESLGGKLSGSVSKKTSVVVYGDQAGSKLEKAQSLGVETMDEAAFEKLFKL